MFPDIFSQISDSAGVMVHPQFDQFLREVLKLPMAVFEGPSFSYSEQGARMCFAQQVRGGGGGGVGASSERILLRVSS